MELKVERYRLLIIPETPQDEAMLEEVFGLKKAGDSVEMKRVNAMGLSCWAYAEIDKPNPVVTVAPLAARKVDDVVR